MLSGEGRIERPSYSAIQPRLQITFSDQPTHRLTLGYLKDSQSSNVFFFSIVALENQSALEPPDTAGV